MWNSITGVAGRVLFSPDPSGGGGSSIGGPVTAGTAGSQPGQQLGDATAKTNADIGSIGPAPGSGGSPAGPAFAGGNDPDAGQLPGVAGKAVDAGLEPGSTDFGADTRSVEGGKGSAGQTSSRSTTAGPGGAAASREGGSAGTSGPGLASGDAPMAGAFGNSVLTTGRPTHADARAALGGAVLPTGATANPKDDAMSNDPGGQTRTAADPSGIGTLGGGTAGTGAVNPTPRTTDLNEGLLAVEGTLPGTDSAGLANAAGATPQTDDDFGSRAVPASGRANPREG